MTVERFDVVVQSCHRHEIRRRDGLQETRLDHRPSRVLAARDTFG
jgi:hypothetical protein